MMALPGNVTTVVVLGTFLTPEGNPSTGTITFTPSRWLNNSGADVAIPNSSVTKTLGTAGNFSVTLPVTDDTDLTPANWYYTVTEVVDGVSQSYDILLPGSAATNGTVYLPDVVPAAALGPEYASIQGPAGSAATIAVGTVTAGTAGGTPTVTNSGSTSAAILDFVLIPGNTGPTGATGATGPQGSAATISVGTVTSGTAGGTPAVTNSGTSGSAVLDFVLIPGGTGPQGATGPAGSAATITVGTVTTVAYGGTASVTNSGTSGSAVLDFVLVTGPQGDLAGLSADAPLDYISNTFSLMYGAGLGTATGGTLVADLSDATPAALGTAGAAGTATKISRADHTHARPTAAEVGAVGTATAVNAGTALAGGGDLSTSRTLNVVLSDATPAAVGTPSAGTATNPSRADHVHEGSTLSSATPAALGTAAAGTATAASRGDHVHPDVVAFQTSAPGSPNDGDLWIDSDSDVTTLNPADYIEKAIVNAKGDLFTGTANDTPAVLTVGTNDTVLTADSSTATGLAWKTVSGLPSQTSQEGQFLITNGTAASWVEPPTNRNLVINGAMQVAQRGTSVTGITSTGAAYRTADRWGVIVTNIGTWTNTLEVDAPTGSGLRESLKILCTAASASPAAGADLRVSTVLEGQDLQRIAKGTSAAQQCTVSFWVKSNVTGTYVVYLFDGDNTRLAAATYSVSASATWEKKTVTFPADTTGALDNDNGDSLYLSFTLAQGSDFTSGSLQTAWAAYTAANRAVGQTNLAAAIDNYWQITGVQLETGPIATPFEFEPYEATLRKCQRYYYRQTPGAAGRIFGTGWNSTTTAAQSWTYFPVPMRAAPSALETTGTASNYRVGHINTFTAGALAPTFVSATEVGAQSQLAVSSGLTAGDGSVLQANTTTAYLGWSAEL